MRHPSILGIAPLAPPLLATRHAAMFLMPHRAGACGHADSRLHVELLPPDNPMRSNLREATGQHG